MYSIRSPVSLFLTNAAAQTDLRPDPRQSPLSRQHSPDLPTGNSNLGVLLPMRSLSPFCTRPNYFASACQTLLLSFPNPSGVRCPPDEPVTHHFPDPVRPGRSQKKRTSTFLISANSSSCPPLLTATVSTRDVNK